MPTILHTLDQTEEDLETLQNAYRAIFLEGECYAFAMALNQGLGWPMVGLMKGEVIWHAGVRSPDGRIHDVRGLLTEDDFGGHFLSSPFDIRPITKDDLYATRSVSDFMIKRAWQLAEVMWPDLPWIDTTTAKVVAFADELEELCRKHGLWIYGGVPADPPRLYLGGGDEGGYELFPTIDGSTHTINRYLNFQVRERDVLRRFHSTS